MGGGVLIFILVNPRLNLLQIRDILLAHRLGRDKLKSDLVAKGISWYWSISLS
jgi:hypothetical protein